MNKFISVFFVIGAMFTLNCQAQSVNSNSGSDSSSQSQSSSTTEGHVQNDVQIVSSAPDSIKYSGSYGVSNVPNVMAPGLVSSLGSDSCLGSASGGGSVKGFGLTFAKTVPDEACQLQRSAVRVYEMADWHRVRAFDFWKKSTLFNDKGQKAAQYYRDKSYKEELVADELAQGGVNIECAINKKVHDALVQAGVACPPFKK